MSTENSGAVTQPIPNTVTQVGKTPAKSEPANQPNKASPANQTQAQAGADDLFEGIELPSDLKGKSLKDIVDAIKTARSEVGRRNNDIGNLRFALDSMLQLRGGEAPKKKEAEAEPVTSDKLLQDPESTISGVAERKAKEALNPAMDRVAALEFELKQAKFEKQFPKAQETLNSQEFLSWIKASPRRQEKATAAYKGSFEAATELFSDYEELTKALAAASGKKDEEQEPNKITDGTTVRPGAGGGKAQQIQKAARTAAKPRYKRGELQMLQIKNPEEYRRRLPEFRQAYAEKRVDD
jgi:hypothetical protein